MRKIVLAGGGTLGSVSPLLAVVKSLPDAQVVFIGTKKGPERDFLKNEGFAYAHIPSTKLRRYISVQTIFDFCKFPFAVIKAFIILRKVKPDLVLTSGGFVAVPVALAAHIQSIPITVHQQDIEVGLANRILSHVATNITVTFTQQKNLFPPKKTVVTGNPVRFSEIPKVVAHEKKRILILGGSQGAYGMNNELNTIIPRLTKDYEVVHVLGTKNYNQRLSLPNNYHSRRFLRDDFIAELSAADVVITRAGMSTLSELAFAQKATIIIPIPHSHQEANANFFKQNKAAIAVPQGKNEELLTAIRELCDHDERRASLGKRMFELFPRDAVNNYTALINRVAKKTSDRSVFLIGIGGSGMSAVCNHFLAHKYSVFGSDLSNNLVVESLSKRGVTVFIGHEKSNIPDRVERVVYSDAVPQSNVELVEAKKRQIPIQTLHEFLGELSRSYETVAISGTHGKTTTTSMAAIASIQADLDPTVVIGAPVAEFQDTNYRKGNSNLLILEADEYRAHMLNLEPRDVILTNIDADHLDFYRDIHDIFNAFQRFVDAQPNDGLAVINADDEWSMKLQVKNRITYGFDDSADYRIGTVTTVEGRQTADIYERGDLLMTLTLHVPGAYNISNAVSVVAYLRSRYAVPPNELERSLAQFTGASRRFERVGTLNGSPVYSDYGHHPTAVKKTIEGIKQFYPGKKLVVAFEPHSYARTKALFNEFAASFNAADHVIITRIYDVAGRDADKSVSGKHLEAAITAKSKEYADTPDEVLAALRKKATPDTILLIMGAGSINELRRTL